MPGQYLRPPTAVRYAYSPTMSPSCWIRFRRIVLTPHLLVISFTYSIPRTTEAWQVPFVTNRLNLRSNHVNGRPRKLRGRPARSATPPVSPAARGPARCRSLRLQPRQEASHVLHDERRVDAVQPTISALVRSV